MYAVELDEVVEHVQVVLGAGEFLGEGSLGVGLVLAARAHGVHGAREYLHALVDEAAQPVEAARRLHLERLDVRDAGWSLPRPRVAM